MRKFVILFFVFVPVLFYACKYPASPPQHLLKVDMSMLDSIRKNSDSTYRKAYGRNDFVTAEYFISKKDSLVTQVMKDSAENIRQVIIKKNNRRIYFAEFYPNGQMIFKNVLDNFGQYHGKSIEFYETGILKRTGMYKHGLHFGKWMNYSENGKCISTDEYDENGHEKK